MEIYDIGIVGAGPAGATLARLLGKRYRILLLDSGRTKCCGGILTSDAQKILGHLDLALPSTVLVDPQPYAVAVLDTENRLARRYGRQYVNIDRAAFDNWLKDMIPPEVDIRRQTRFVSSDTAHVEAFESNDRTVTIRFREKEETQTATVRWLVGADGAFSTVRRLFFSDKPFPKRYVALQDWYDEKEVRIDNSPIDFWSDYVGVFDSNFTDFYAWTIPKNRRLIVGGALPIGEKPRKKFEELKRKLEEFGLRLGKPMHHEADQIFRPTTPSSIYFGSERIILLGEAAGLISPSSAEGISSALRNAMLLADAFAEGQFDAAVYRRSLRTLKWYTLAKKAKIPMMFFPGIRKQIMLSGILALK